MATTTVETSGPMGPTEAKDVSASKGLGNAQPAIGNGGATSSKKQRRPGRPILPSSLSKSGEPIQFLREQVYAVARNRRPPKKKTQEPREATQSISSIVGEAVRRSPEHYQHLTEQGLTPHRPRCLFGLDVEELEHWVDTHIKKAAANLRDMRIMDKVVQRRQDPRLPTLLAAVASHPDPPDDNNERYRAWRAAVVDWARNHYGTNLVSVLEHTDEGHGHLHILVADPDARPVKTLHAGHSAALRATGQVNASALGQAYRDGCQALQDEFHEQVGRKCGMLRISPAPYARHSWHEHKLRQQLAGEVAEIEDGLQKRAKQIANRAQRVTDEALALDRRQRLLAVKEGELSAMELAMRRALERREAKLQDEEIRLRRAIAEAEGRERDARAQADAVLDWIKARLQDGTMTAAEAKQLTVGLGDKMRTGPWR